MRLEVRAEVDGEFRQVGAITTHPGSGERFTYSDWWIAAMPDAPISLSLPVSPELYEARAMRPYFEGLLPEEDARKTIARLLGVPSTSYLKMLSALAGECIGAVSIGGSSDGASGQDASGRDIGGESGYEPLTYDELETLAEKGYSCAGDYANRSRLSLAGAQAKTGLYLAEDRVDGPDAEGSACTWFLPRGGAPSTHVVKPASGVFAELVQNELWCMKLAESCGLPVASARIDPAHRGLLIVRRYDRIFDGGDGDGRILDGLPVPRRLHQEDFCQALGVLPADKYEERDQRNLPLMFSLLSEYSTDPLADRDALIDLIAFNYFIGNCDAHLKNYSLLRSADWTELRLAPAYDLVCTSAYEGPTRTLGMRIGGARRLDDVDRASFEELAREIRVAPKMVLARVDELGMRVRDALRIQRSQETEEVEGAEGAEGAEDAEGAERPGAFGSPTVKKCAEQCEKRVLHIVG